MTILIFLLISYILLSIALYFVFPKANIEAWKGLVPGLNFMEWCEIIGRPKWWAALLLIPIVNLFIFAGMCVDLVRSFGKFGLGSSALAVFYPPAILGSLGMKADEKYHGPVLKQEQSYFTEMREAKEAQQERKLNKLVKNNPYRKTAGREWIESIFFAVFAAAFIRMFLVEAYVIPTPSMEGSLMVGDFLFVSKTSYGIRTPMTVAMVPLLHNRLPVVGGESYLKSPSLPYFRLPALRNIDRNTPFVFNWPVGDSVYITNSRSYTLNQIKQQPNWQVYDRQLAEKVRTKDYVTRPLDKKDHYIKRCVGVPGDSLQVIDRKIFINGEQQKDPINVQYKYQVRFPSTSFNKRKLPELGIDDSDYWQGQGGIYGYFMTESQADILRTLDPQMQVALAPQSTDPNLFPFDQANYGQWSLDNYGPIYLPKKGVTTPLSLSNLSMYKRIIKVYEGNDLEVKGDRIYINGQEADEYTFKQDYFWAMGDNRHNSEDSRAWGYVPHDHIVGKPLFIWFSTKNGSISNGINWNRIFKSANVD